MRSSDRHAAEASEAGRASPHDSIVIHSGPLSMFGAKAEMAAIEKGIVWERRFVPFSIRSLYQPKSSAVVRINPKQQVPVLTHGDLEIFDSTQIFEYLEDVQPTPPLWPTNLKDRARARLLELKSDEVFFPDVANCMPLRRAAAGEQAFSKSVEGIHQYLAEMDLILADQDYLAHDFSYADIAFFAAQFFVRFLGQPPSSELKNLERWRQKMNDRKSVQEVMGKMASYLSANGIEASV